MPNTFVSRSKLHARLVWLAKWLTHSGRVYFVAGGKTRRHYHVAWL
jgi:hypothetical protein